MLHQGLKQKKKVDGIHKREQTPVPCLKQKKIIPKDFISLIMEMVLN